MIDLIKFIAKHKANLTIKYSSDTRAVSVMVSHHEKPKIALSVSFTQEFIDNNSEVTDTAIAEQTQLLMARFLELKYPKPIEEPTSEPVDPRKGLDA